jgi:L-fuconate dehydratase
MFITNISTEDLRFPLKEGEGVDSVHSNPVYSYAVTKLHGEKGTVGTGITFTLGDGNDLVCRAIDMLSECLLGKDITEFMDNFGVELQSMANHPRLRWLGPHKGVVHLALASITNACFDLWAKQQQKPLWKLLIELSPEQIVKLLDFTGIEDVLTSEEALALLHAQQLTRDTRIDVLKSGYPGYDTSVGWINYEDKEIIRRSNQAVETGFGAVKLKVGSDDPQRDIRRLYLLRESLGDDIKIMLDANQKWSLSEALSIGADIKGMQPFWIEEPLHPDDATGHSTLQHALSPVSIAVGEHIPNAVLFKNFMQMNAMKICQVDCTRVAGVSEFILVSLMAKKYNLKVIPHVGDMGQLHQHLVIFNHIALGLEKLFLEYIPHMQDYFEIPAIVKDGIYHLPQEPGASCDFKPLQN